MDKIWDKNSFEVGGHFFFRFLWCVDESVMVSVRPNPRGSRAMPVYIDILPYYLWQREDFGVFVRYSDSCIICRFTWRWAWQMKSFRNILGVQLSWHGIRVHIQCALNTDNIEPTFFFFCVMNKQLTVKLLTDLLCVCKLSGFLRRSQFFNAMNFQ